MAASRAVRAGAATALVFLGFFWFFTLRIVWKNYLPDEEDVSLLLKYWGDFAKPVLATAFAAATMAPFMWLALSHDPPGASTSRSQRGAPTDG